MQSTLYQEAYEKGKLDGLLIAKREAELKGKFEGEAKMVIKFLTIRLGVLPLELIRKIETTDSDTLDRIMDESFAYKSIDEVFRGQ